MLGASVSVDGRSGAVPKPVTGDHGKFLRGDGSWVTLPSGSGNGDVLAANKLAEFDTAAKRKDARVNLGVQAMTRGAKSVAGGSDVTLTADEADHQVLDLTGVLTADIAVILPQIIGKLWLVQNNTTGNFLLTIRTSGGLGVMVRRGCSELVTWNGTDMLCLNTDSNEKSDVRSRALAGGLVYEGGTSARVTHALGNQIGTSDFTLMTVFRVPVGNPLTGKGVLALCNSSSTRLSPGAMQMVLSSSGVVQVNLRGSTTADFRRADFPNMVAEFGGRVVTVFVVRQGGVLKLFINGRERTYTEVTGGTPPDWSANVDSTYLQCGIGNTSNDSWVDTIYANCVWNYALSQEQIIQVSKHGLALNDLGGSMTPLISPAVLNGGFETAGAGGADVFANWLESVSGTSTLSRDTAEFNSGTASCKMVVDGSGSSASIHQTSVLTTGRRYRMEFLAKRSNVATGAIQVGNATAPAAYGTTTALTTSWAKYTFEFTAAETSLLLARAVSVSNNAELFIDDVIVQPLGALACPDLSAGSGLQIPDLSENKAHGLISGSINHLQSRRRGQVRARTNTNGNQQLCGGTCLLPSARLFAVIANVASGTPTITIGNASGGSQIATSQALVTGRNEITLASRYSSTGNVWINSNSTDAIDWTLLYEIVD